LISIKKTLSTLLAFALAASALVLTPSPSNAAGLPSSIAVSVGEVFYHSLAPGACETLPEGSSGPVTYAIDGTLPTGIGLNPNTGVITGIFEEAGTWVMTGQTHCYFTGSNGNQSGAGYPTNATFVVYPEPADETPTPFLSVNSNGGPNCELQIVGEFPEAQDPGTGVLYIESDGGVIEISLVSQAADTPFTLIVPLNDWRPGDDPLIASWDRDGEVRCSSEIDFRLGYRYRTAPFEFAEVNNIYATFDLGVSPHITSLPFGDSYCSVYLTGRFLRSGDLGTKPTVTVQSETGEVTVMPTVDRQGRFFVRIPLDDIREFSFSDGALVLNGPVPSCGEEMGARASIWVGGEELTSWSDAYATRFCDPGSFDNGEQCLPTPAGTYAPSGGLTSPILCPKGTFQENIGSDECLDSPVGTYVGTKGAILPTTCPSGKVTFEPGAVHVSECYSLKNQAFTSLKVASKLKFGASVTIPAETDNRIPVTITSIGVCTQIETTMRVKVGKVTRDVRAVRITAGSVAGTCGVNITNNGDPYFRGYTKNLVIKVSRTGK
jgi:hypothetical protein